ncbi:MAG: hypothetical protein A2X86_16025 [Bdellovibrionales bacterium GWA2_49_15]|nr:MAG: hypothetical protein A2X86_16025 [Bdellovibrionales bacterium GWA2_49_15]HAZ13192.1 hypothetical protein [Bdellovibrionales bacterium]
MNRDEPALRLKAGRVFQAVRNFHDYGQMEVAREFQISQSNVSKIEVGILAPDLRFWMEFTRAFNVKDPYCFNYGSAEIDGIPKLGHVGKKFYMSTGFRIPKCYQKSEALITSRKIRPLIEVFEQSLEKPWNAFLSDTGIPCGIFDILNFPLPALMVQDLATFFNKYAAKINFGVNLDITSQVNHGLMFQDYDSIKTPLNVLKHFIHKQKEYGVDFEYAIPQGNGNESSISIEILPTLAELVSKKELANNRFFNICAQYPLFLMKMKDVSTNPRLIWPSEGHRVQSREVDVLPVTHALRAA